MQKRSKVAFFSVFVGAIWGPQAPSPCKSQGACGSGPTSARSSRGEGVKEAQRSSPIRFDMCHTKSWCPPGQRLFPLLSQIRNAHACTSAAICRACDPPHTLSLARTRLRTSRLCGSVCSGRFTLCDVLPTPSPASSSSTRVPIQEPVLRLCVRRYPIHAHACSRARGRHTDA